MDGWVDGEEDGWMGGWRGGWLDGWVERRMDGWVDGEEDRWMERRMDGWDAHYWNVTIVTPHTHSAPRPPSSLRLRAEPLTLVVEAQ